MAQRRTCKGRWWKHKWQQVGKRQICDRCGKLNPMGVPPHIRFWDHVKLSPGCWLWDGATNHGGYGLFTVGSKPDRKTWGAYKYAWFLKHGSVPPAPLDVHHVCNNRLCVRPRHLRAVTRKENIQAQPGYGICKRGHKISGKNEYRYGAGKRKCRKCIVLNRKAKVS